MQGRRMADYKDEALAYLRKVIDETGRTATELARLVGVSPTTFTRPLNGNYIFDSPNDPGYISTCRCGISRIDKPLGGSLAS